MPRLHSQVGQYSPGRTWAYCSGCKHVRLLENGSEAREHKELLITGVDILDPCTPNEPEPGSFPDSQALNASSSASVFEPRPTLTEV